LKGGERKCYKKEEKNAGGLGRTKSGTTFAGGEARREARFRAKTPVAGAISGAPLQENANCKGRESNRGAFPGE